jgi:hypothetical protein
MAINFLEFPLNYQNAGATVEVTLQGVESDVFLVDNANLSSFKRGRQFTYQGGHYKKSPVVLGVATSGTWTVVVIPGPGGRVSASVRVLTTT